jgi:hypothetical protein
MKGDYAQTQAQRDREYERAWESEETRQWLAKMKPEERRALEAQGLLKPMLAKHGSGMLDKDAAESNLASEEPDIISQIEPEPERVSGSCADIDERVMDVLRRLLGEVLTQKNARLTLECLAVACGLTTLQGESMTNIAKRHGISRAAVSKRCVDITEKLNLPPSRAMRSRTARKSYQRAQKHYRRIYERDRN